MKRSKDPSSKKRRKKRAKARVKTRRVNRPLRKNLKKSSDSKSNRKKRAKSKRIIRPLRKALRKHSLHQIPFKIPAFSRFSFKRKRTKKKKKASETEGNGAQLEEISVSVPNILESQSQESRYAPGTPDYQNSYNDSAYEQTSYTGLFSDRLMSFVGRMEGVIFDKAKKFFVFSKFENRKGLNVDRYVLDQGAKIVKNMGKEEYVDPDTSYSSEGSRKKKDYEKLMDSSDN